MICPDCQTDGRQVTCIFDAKQMGEVCPRCQRVYGTVMPTMHYASEKACHDRIRRDKRAQKLENYRLQSLTERIIKRDA